MPSASCQGTVHRQVSLLPQSERGGVDVDPQYWLRIPQATDPSGYGSRIPPATRPSGYSSRIPLAMALGLWGAQWPTNGRASQSVPNRPKALSKTNLFKHRFLKPEVRTMPVAL